MENTQRTKLIVTTLKTLFWVSWTYPLLRIWAYIPYAMVQDSLTYKQNYYFKEYLRVFHGGRDVSFFLMSGYFYAYLFLSAALYLAWHYRAKRRVSWKVRILLPLMLLLNIMTSALQEINVYLHIMDNVKEEQAIREEN